jgi:hypothetical protein
LIIHNYEEVKGLFIPVAFEFSRLFPKGLLYVPAGGWGATIFSEDARTGVQFQYIRLPDPFKVEGQYLRVLYRLSAE